MVEMVLLAFHVERSLQIIFGDIQHDRVKSKGTPQPLGDEKPQLFQGHILTKVPEKHGCFIAVKLCKLL